MKSLLYITHTTFFFQILFLNFGSSLFGVEILGHGIWRFFTNQPLYFARICPQWQVLFQNRSRLVSSLFLIVLGEPQNPIKVGHLNEWQYLKIGVFEVGNFGKNSTLIVWIYSPVVDDRGTFMDLNKSLNSIEPSDIVWRTIYYPNNRNFCLFKELQSWQTSEQNNSFA